MSLPIPRNIVSKQGKVLDSARGDVRRVKYLRDRITRSIPWVKFVVSARAHLAAEKP